MTPGTDSPPLRFSGRRVACPECGSARGFAPSIDDPDVGYCHACRARIDPRAGAMAPVGGAGYRILGPSRPAAIARGRMAADVGPWRHVATWAYTDEAGAPLYCVDRYERYHTDGARYDKTFRQRPADHPRRQGTDRDRTPHGASIVGVRRVLWDLPEALWAMRNSGRVFICEGEKAAESLTDYLRYEDGGPDRATTAAGGAAGWAMPHGAAYAATLRGARVVLWPDDDEAGERWTRDVVAALRGVAGSIDVGGPSHV